MSPADEVLDSSAPPLYRLANASFARGGGLPGKPLLTLVSLLATMLSVRAADVLTQLLAQAAHTLATSSALLATEISAVSQLAAFEALMTPVATAAASHTLTGREFSTFTHAAAPVLFEAARTFELIHWLLFAQSFPHTAPQVITQLLRLVGLASRYSPDVDKVSDLVMPHFRAAVRRSMLEHAALDEVSTPYNAVNALIYALRTIVNDLRREASVRECLPAGFLAASAAQRYKMIVRAVEAAWRGAPGAATGEVFSGARLDVDYLLLDESEVAAGALPFCHESVHCCSYIHGSAA